MRTKLLLRRAWLNYRLALLLRVPIEPQARLLPSPAHPGIWWTRIENITFYSHKNHVYPRRSIFKPMTDANPRSIIHETVRAMFLQGQAYDTTAQYRLMMKSVRTKPWSTSNWNCRTPAQVENYFALLIQAFAAMRRDGYLTQEELEGRKLGGFEEPDEICLSLNANGQLVHMRKGQHRIRMAEILGIRWVAFILQSADPRWVATMSRRFSLPPHLAIAEWMDIQKMFKTRRPQQQHEA